MGKNKKIKKKKSAGVPVTLPSENIILGSTSSNQGLTRRSITVNLKNFNFKASKKYLNNEFFFKGFL